MDLQQLATDAYTSLRTAIDENVTSTKRLEAEESATGYYKILEKELAKQYQVKRVTDINRDNAINEQTDKLILECILGLQIMGNLNKKPSLDLHDSNYQGQLKKTIEDSNVGYRRINALASVLTASGKTPLLVEAIQGLEN